MFTAQYDALYQAWTGTGLHLDSLLLWPFVRIFGFTHLAAFAFDLFFVSAVWLLQPRLRLLILTPLLLWPGNWLAKCYLLIFAVLLRLPSRVAIFLLFIPLAVIASRPAVPTDRFDTGQVLVQINQFRGEHMLTSYSFLGRFFHNKLSFIPAFVTHSLPAINPSWLFGWGDRNSTSNSLWIPPLTLFFLPLIVLAFLRPPRPRFFLLLATISWLMTAVQNQHLSESSLILYFACLVLIAHQVYFSLSPLLKKAFVIGNFVYLLPAAYFSVHFHPVYQIPVTGYGLDQVITYAQKNSGQTIYLADDLYLRPQSQISFLLQSKDTANIRVTPALDPLFTAATSSAIRLVSRAPKLPHELTSRLRLDPITLDRQHQPLIYRLNYAPL